MVQGYYTLQEAADVLGMSIDELKGLAQKNQIRSFQDRGTLRFRIQDIQELQRQRIGNSDPEMVLGDAVSPKPIPAPKSGAVKTPRPQSGAKSPPVFDFQLDDSVEVGQEALAPGSSARKGPKSPGAKPSPRTPKKGSDSDVKLIADGSDSFSIQLGEDIKPSTGDSDVRLGELTVKKPGGSSARKPASGQRPRSSPPDSGVRLVPMSDDSDIQLDARETANTDSDIRLDDKGPLSPPRTAGDSLGNTEEINLDEEIKRLEAAAKKPDAKIKTDLAKPGALALDLSETDSGEQQKKDGSSDFEIAAAAPKGQKGGPKSGAKKGADLDLALGDSDEDFSLQLESDALDLGADPAATRAPKSGINLGRPSDRGVSLEAQEDDSGESTEFELSLDAGPATPRPSKNKSNDPDSEFELSLDDSSNETPALKDEADSEFELSLGESSPTDSPMADSDGDFELALDDGSSEAPAPKSKPKAKAKAKVESSDEHDIFETDFELPALDDESSGEETVDGGSSDFELALDDSDVAPPEDESGSQVVALDEEEGFEGEEGDLEAVEEGDIEAEEEVEVREKVVEKVVERVIKPAPWGALPVAFMTPCVIILVLVGLMGWELVQTASGFKSSGVLTRSIADIAGMKVK
jgi:hypothetical protein